LPQLLPAYYFRRTFLAPSAELEELLLSATCTDVSAAGFFPLHLYLNGTEVKTFLDTVTMQGNETRYCDLTPFATLIHPPSMSSLYNLAMTGPTMMMSPLISVSRPLPANRRRHQL